MAKCSTCGYTIQTLNEERLYDLYGCARAKVTQDLAFSIEMCGRDYSTGQFYAPGSKPDSFEEDSNSFKETYQKLLDQNNANRKK